MTDTPPANDTDLLLEVVQVPVSDVDRAKAFYTEKAGFNLDFDNWHGEIRVVQLTPPGSSCSVVIGTGYGFAEMAPGSLRGLQLITPDLRATHAALAERGLELSEIEVIEESGPRPSRGDDELDNVGFAYFRDPDGNRWALQQISARGQG
jgi:catechol 2,3-dioxygenase-like lactoylglutathione lyase family enzyme